MLGHVTNKIHISTCRRCINTKLDVLIKSGHSPKYSGSRVSSGLYAFFCLKNVTFLHSFSKRKHIGHVGPDLQFVWVVKSIYDSLLRFLFLVGAEGPAYLSKPEEFLLQLCLIEGRLLEPPDVKVVTSTARCDSL